MSWLKVRKTTNSTECTDLLNHLVMMVLWFVHWACDEEVAGSTPSHPTTEYYSQQVVHTHMTLSPSSIILYQSKGRMFFRWEDSCCTGQVPMHNRLGYIPAYRLITFGRQKSTAEHRIYAPRVVTLYCVA